LLKPPAGQLLETIYQVMNRVRGSAHPLIRAGRGTYTTKERPGRRPLFILVAEDNDFMRNFWSNFSAARPPCAVGERRPEGVVLGERVPSTAASGRPMPELDGFQVIQNRERDDRGRHCLSLH